MASKYHDLQFTKIGVTHSSIRLKGNLATWIKSFKHFNEKGCKKKKNTVCVYLNKF